MEPTRTKILTINGGSSSIKFAVYDDKGTLERILYGQIDRIGLPSTTLTFTDTLQGQEKIVEEIPPETPYYSKAISTLISWLDKRVDLSTVKVIGHRIVHGVHYTEHQLITPEVLGELRRGVTFDPNHLPYEIELLEEFSRLYPELLHVACFDTVFHSTMPRVAEIIPVPRRLEKIGLKRYGFHGLSYDYLIRELATIAGTDTANGRVIIAHLGSGASLCALKDGKSVDTSMGFSPAGGIPMSSRSGDLDPSVLWFMVLKEKLSPDQLNDIINLKSGLLGISETTADMHDLLGRQAEDVRSAEAVALFCYEIKKKIGAYAAVLGGVDTLIFSGGIGEQSAEIRSRVCDNLEFLGISIDKEKNDASHGVISLPDRHVTVRVMHTNEESMIAQIASRITKGTN